MPCGPSRTFSPRRPGSAPDEPAWLDEPNDGRLCSRPGKEVLGMISRLIKAVLIAALLALVIDSLPDIKRYLELRDM
jgi:hypothetical protein